MNTKQKREILLLGVSQDPLEAFKELLSEFYEVSLFTSVEQLYPATSPDNSVILFVLEGDYKKLLDECRKKCTKERIIGVYDGGIKDYLPIASEYKLNALISFNLSIDKIAFVRFINGLYRKNTVFGVALGVTKAAKVLKTTVKSIEVLPSMLAKIASFIAPVRKIPPEIFIKILHPIIASITGTGKEIELVYALDHTRLAFNIVLKNFTPIVYPESFYANIFTEVSNPYDTLKQSIQHAITEADELIVTLHRDSIEFLLIFQLKVDAMTGKSISIPGEYEQYSSSLVEQDKPKETEAALDMDKEDVKDDFEEYLTKGDNILSIDVKKKTEDGKEVLQVDLKLDLPEINTDKMSPIEALKMYQEQHKILKDKLTEVTKKFYEANIRMKRAEEVAEVISDEIKILMKQRKEPTTDQELKDIKMKLEAQIDNLYKEIGIEKAKNKKLAKQIELLKQDLLAERMEKDKLNALIRDKEKEIKELDQQLSLAIKTSSDF